MCQHTKVRGQDVTHGKHIAFIISQIISQSDAVPFSHIGMLVHQVVVLRSLRSKLCEALAEVHSTTSALHLRVTKHEDADGHTGQSSSAGEGSHTEHLFQQARQAIVQTCNSCSQVSLIWHS